MKRSPGAIALALILVLGCLTLVGAQPPAAAKANYELASRWTAAKVGKLVFDGQVQPRWLESGDRFWYAYETSQGRKWFIVDPALKTRKPLFDNAKMAALLTNRPPRDTVTRTNATRRTGQSDGARSPIPAPQPLRAPQKSP